MRNYKYQMRYEVLYSCKADVHCTFLLILKFD